MILHPYFRNSLNPIQQVFQADFNGKLVYDFIPTAQKITQHYNLTGISPFLDNDVVNFGLHLPLDQKYHPISNRGKLTLRKITNRLNVEHIDEKKGFSPDTKINVRSDVRYNADIYVNLKPNVNFSAPFELLPKEQQVKTDDLFRKSTDEV